MNTGSNSHNIPEEYLSPYDHKKYEPEIAEYWNKSDVFNPDTCIKNGWSDENKKPFSMVLPPPNVTGRLHTGHSLMLTIEDIATRFYRMMGNPTLWIPGADHAAIATESKVVKQLAKKKIRKSDLTREEFLEEVNKFAEASKSEIINQIKRMGAGLDWSRFAYTLDEKRQKAVFEAFKRLYDLGLIYQGDRIVNWDTKGQTTVSDDEVIYKEEKSKFYYFKYGPFVIGTARPETKFADKYIVVHPDDDRYAEYEHGQEFEVEWINGKIKATLLKDEVANPEMGSGAMTITPWHSLVDFELAEKYNLEKVQIIDKYGKLTDIAGEFAGMKITEARDKIVEKLASKGLLVEVDEDYTHNVGTSERTGAIIEPQIMKQWFIAVNKPFVLKNSQIDGIESGATVTLKELMLHVVKSGQIKILPSRFEKVYFNWINNLRDWCISRQIYFGHRIPVWYKEDDLKISETSPGEGWARDEDTLDTWFSSGLWTFSTLGWPENTEDLKKYHPTTLLETGYDIIFFWVARMVLMSTALLGQVPFETVYLHGLVRDERGRKISKSLGNNIDPLELIDKYGADALRMAQIVGVGPGQDNNLGENKIKAYRKFANKIWNVARFVLSNTNENDIVDNIDWDNPDKDKIGEEFGDYSEYVYDLAQKRTKWLKNMEKYEFYIVAEELYHYIWHTFADKIIEEAKKDISNREQNGSVEKDMEQSVSATRARKALRTIFAKSVKLLHPFMPHITEKIYGDMENTDNDKRKPLPVTSW